MVLTRKKKFAICALVWGYSSLRIGWGWGWVGEMTLREVEEPRGGNGGGILEILGAGHPSVRGKRGEQFNRPWGGKKRLSAAW